MEKNCNPPKYLQRNTTLQTFIDGVDAAVVERSVKRLNRWFLDGFLHMGTPILSNDSKKQDSTTTR